MVSKGKVADPRAAFAGADAISIGDVFAKNTKPNSRSAMAPSQDVGAKKLKTGSLPMAPPAPPPPRVGRGESQLGKSKFFEECIRLTTENAGNCLLGFGKLVLDSRPGDYGKMRVYSGSSSSGKEDFIREESY